MLKKDKKKVKELIESQTIFKFCLFYQCITARHDRYCKSSMLLTGCFKIQSSEPIAFRQLNVFPNYYY